MEEDALGATLAPLIRDIWRDSMRTFRAISSLVVISAVMGTGYLVQSSEDRINDLEDRVLRLEATVEVLANGAPAESSSETLHDLVGVFIEAARSRDGTACGSFYPAGTIVFLSDWAGNVLGTGELGAGEIIESTLCAQPFAFTDIPEREGNTFNVERRVAGSAYEFSFADMEAADWEIVVRFRYISD